jgi:restriction endonuclease S subunit
MVEDGVPFIRGTNLVEGKIIAEDIRFISEEKHAQLKKGHLKTNDILFTNRGEIGKVAIVDERFDGANLNSQLAWLRAKENLLPTYLLTVLQSALIQDRLLVEKNGATLQQYTIKQLKELEIPLPPLTEQQAIVSEIEAEQALVNANRELITRFEAKIQTTISRIWGEGLKDEEITIG